MLDHIFGVEIPARCAPPSNLRWAWNEVSQLGGDARVNKLAVSLGWSTRHFISKFQESTGLTPKAQARRSDFRKLGHIWTKARFRWLRWRLSERGRLSSRPRYCRQDSLIGLRPKTQPELLSHDCPAYDDAEMEGAQRKGVGRRRPKLLLRNVCRGRRAKPRDVVVAERCKDHIRIRYQRNRSSSIGKGLREIQLQLRVCRWKGTRRIDH